MLLELLGVVAEHMPEELASNNNAQSFLPYLINRWNSLKDTDDGMLSLIECLIYVIMV